MFSENNFRVQEVRELRRQLQNLTAYINELEQQVINRMMAQQSEMQNQFAEQPAGSVDPKMQIELQKAQLKLAEMQEKRAMSQEAHQQKMETIRQQMALNDLKTRSSILQKTAAPPKAGGRPPLIDSVAE